MNCVWQLRAKTVALGSGVFIALMPGFPRQTADSHEYAYREAYGTFSFGENLAARLFVVQPNVTWLINKQTARPPKA